MPPRSELQTLFESLIGTGNVYFQPPSSVRMAYPCIVYERSNIQTKFADNLPYSNAKQYRVTVIDKDPDSIIPDEILKLPKCVFDRHYNTENLNHDVFILFF